MALAYQGKAVCNQSQYWTQFLINFVAVIGLLGLAIFSLLRGSWGIAILAFLAIAPMGIWFRIVMVRRCRDIGWPTFLPWLMFGGGVAFNMLRIGGGGAAAMQQGSLGGAALLPLMIGLVDFGFMVTIGCIATKRQDYAHVFEDEPIAARPAQPAYHSSYAEPAPARRPGVPQPESEQEARWDAAIAAALAARQQGEPAPSVAAAPAPPQRPLAPGPAMARPAGFGRKVV